jgi:DNA-binding GntR family transcriptional regulator
MSAEAGQGTNGGTRDGQHVALVHDRLRAAILLGELPAGQTTSQVTLARDLEVGRTPLREALRMLQREGLVVSEPNRRVRIAALSSTDAEELYVMRIALEAVAIRITVPTLTSTDFAELEGLMAQMDHYMRSEDRMGMRVPHRAFHDRFVRAAGERVTTTIGQLFDHGERYRLRYGATTPERWDQRRAEHRAIVDAAAAGDADLAARHLVAHYAQTASFIFAALDPGHDLARLRTTMATVAPGSETSLRIPG